MEMMKLRSSNFPSETSHLVLPAFSYLFHSHKMYEVDEQKPGLCTALLFEREYHHYLIYEP